MVDVPVKDGPEEIVFQGRMVEVVRQPMKHQGVVQVYESARRTPGIRIIIPDRKTKEVILTREFRAELDDYDVRVPGGKVFNSLKEFNVHTKSGRDIQPIALDKVKEEALEEVGIVIEEASFFKLSKNGSIMEWDLLYFVAEKWHEHTDGAQHKEFEQGVISAHRYSYAQAEKLITDGTISEDRSAIVLLRWLASVDDHS